MKEVNLAENFQTINTAASRFVPIESRTITCSLPLSYWDNIARNSCYVSWKDIAVQKDSLQIVATQQLIQELQPKTIIEFGSFRGGSALWLADIQESCVKDGKVVSLDIDLGNVDLRVRHDPRIEFIQGNSNYIEQALPIQKLKDFLHPILVIEDAHINTVGILDYFHDNLLKLGDYFIVEDTNIDYNNACYKVLIEEFDHSYCNNKLENLNNKIVNLKSWLQSKDNAYLVDTKYVDPFGIVNATKNWNSVIKKVK